MALPEKPGDQPNREPGYLSAEPWQPKKGAEPGASCPAISGPPADADFETRRRILEAARELFTTKGFKGVSMRDVAEVVKVTPAALYYHFPQGKEELFIEVVKRIFEDNAQATHQAAAAGKSTREKLFFVSVRNLSGIWKSSGWPILMRDVNQYLPEEKQPEIWKYIGMTYVSAIKEVFQEGVEKGEISPHIPPETLASMFHSMNMAYNWNPRFRDNSADQVEIERAANTIVSVLFDGVGLRKA